MGRIYNRQLKCGCLISTDGGGGVVPCFHFGYNLFDTPEEEKKYVKICNDAWAEWKKTKDYQDYQKELKQ